VNLSDWAD